MSTRSSQPHRRTPCFVAFFASPFFASMLFAGLLFASLLFASLLVAPATDAADSFLRRTGSPDDSRQTNPAEQNGRRLLREGTLIPPTPGRIAMIGRRWVFIPSTTAAAGREPAIPETQIADPGNPLAPTNRFGDTANRLAATSRGNDASASPMITARLPTDSSEPAETEEATVGQMLITENLMLQRIVEAIGEDPADDRWTVTGEVTEFQDQNRLILRTAQRANSK